MENKEVNSIVKFIYYLQETMEHSYIENIVVKIRSKLDMDVLISVSSPDKILQAMMTIESNLYIKPMLKAKKVARLKNSISVLTHNDETIKIFIYDKDEFDEITKGRIS